MLQLIDLLLSLPASSADCERGLCLVKVIKSDWKSRLRGTVVTDLMTVQLHSPEIATLIHPYVERVEMATCIRPVWMPSNLTANSSHYSTNTAHTFT